MPTSRETTVKAAFPRWGHPPARSAQILGRWGRTRRSEARPTRKPGCACWPSPGTGDVLMSRLREGRANTARGAAHFLRETVGRVRYAGANRVMAPEEWSFQSEPDAAPVRSQLALFASYSYPALLELEADHIENATSQARLWNPPAAVCRIVGRFPSQETGIAPVTPSTLIRRI